MIPIYESADRSSLQPMGRAPRGWTEQIGAAWEAQRWVENVNQERRSDLDLYSRRIDEVREATGVRLDHPLLIHDPRERRLEGSRIERFEARIAELRTGNPDYAAAIRSREDWEAERRARIQEIAADAEGLEFVPALVGGVLGSFEDPLNLATLPIGGGKNIVTVAAREAGVNALVEGASLPAAQRWRQEMGLAELTGDEMAFRVGVGAVFGAVAGGGGRALEIGWNRLPLNRQAEALRELAPESAEARGLADLIDREAAIDDANPLGTGPAADAAHREFMDWGREAAEGFGLSDANPYRNLEISPAAARTLAEDDLFVRAARLGDPLPDELTSIRQVRAASPERVAEWYDRNVVAVERGDMASSLTVRSPDADMVMHLTGDIAPRRTVMFGLDGRTVNADDIPPREAVAAGARTMARAGATLRGFIDRHPDVSEYHFTGATPAHNRFYRSLLASFDIPEWRAYTGPRQSQFAVVRAGSEAEEQLLNGRYTRIEPRRPRSPEGGGDDGRGDRGGSGRDRVREPAAGGTARRRRDTAPRLIDAPDGATRQSDLFDQPGGEGARGQLAQMEAEQRAYADAADDDMIPTGRIIDGEPEMVSRAAIEAELADRQSLLAKLRTCSLGGGGS